MYGGISESGTAFVNSGYATPAQALQKSNFIATSVGCERTNFNNNEAFLNCLRNVSVSDLLTAQALASQGSTGNTTFVYVQFN